MRDFRGQLQQLPDWWFRVCTGHTTYSPLDEELYRQRLLVMTSFFWLLNVGLLTIATPLLIDFTPEGRLAAQVLFVVAALGVLISILALRHLKSRVLALNVLLVILTGAFSSACFIFGGSLSPTFILMLLVPVAAAIAGSVYLTVSWTAVVLVFWSTVVVAERSGIVFLQIIKPENHSAGMTTAYAALALSVVTVILVYAEMNKRLRTSLQASNIELAHLSAHDQLTGLPNRRFYDKRVTQALHRAAERNELMGLLFIDLNDFKQINDTYGHGAGDKLLVTVAQRLQSSLRETDLIARMGGDEFAVVLEDIRSTDELTRIAHKLSQAVEQPVSVRQLELKFGASIGLAIFPIDGRQKQELEEQADKAMYYAKQRGLPVVLSSLEPDNVPRPVRQRHDT